MSAALVSSFVGLALDAADRAPRPPLTFTQVVPADWHGSQGPVAQADVHFIWGKFSKMSPSYHEAGGSPTFFSLHLVQAVFTRERWDSSAGSYHEH